MTNNNQQGFALAVSLVLTLILTLMGFWAASTGKVLQQISTTAVRYDEVYAVAESELSRLIAALKEVKEEIPTGEGTTINNDQVFTQVWAKEKLAAKFNGSSDNTAIADFNNFESAGWNDSAAIKTIATSEAGAGDIRTAYGQIETRSFVQELVSRSLTNNAGSETVDKHYLITVKAFAKAAMEASALTTAAEKETVVLESVYKLSFIR